MLKAIDFVATNVPGMDRPAHLAGATVELLARIAAPVSGVVMIGSEATPNDYYYYRVGGGSTPPKIFKSINQRVLWGVNPPQVQTGTTTATGGG